MTDLIEKLTPRPYSPSGLFRGDAPVTDWASIRIWVLDRDGQICQICKLRRATDADHIWPRRLGGIDHIDNLRAACGPCNKAKGDRVNVRAADSMQLMSAVAELTDRIRALTEEREIYTNALALLGMRGSDEALDRLRMFGLSQTMEAQADLDRARCWLEQGAVAKSLRDRTATDGVLVIGGSGHYAYEPDRLLADTNGDLIHNRDARVRFKVAESRRAHNTAHEALMRAIRDENEATIFADWTTKEFAKGRSADEITWDTCVRETGIWKYAEDLGDDA
jgi:HNH endonuclease